MKNNCDYIDKSKKEEIREKGRKMKKHTQAEAENVGASGDGILIVRGAVFRSESPEE